MIIREALTRSAAGLKEAGIETSSLDASLLLAHILNVSRTALFASETEPLPEEKFAALRALIQRRLNGECTAYILGKKEFRGLEFLVNPSVLVPRPDTETLVEAALEILENNFISKTPRASAVKNSSENDNAIRVLDLCTGSGAVAVSLKNEMPEIEVYAADISADALETAKLNAQRLLPSVSVQFFLSDLYGALPCPPFHLIVSNPPYIAAGEIINLPPEVQKEPRVALDGGQDGLEIIRRIIEGAPGKLRRGGSLLLEADPSQMKKIAGLLEKNGFYNIKLYNDLSGKERVTGGTY